MAPNCNLQVLIVDDDSGIRDVLRGFLESRNCAVLQASSGAEALDILDKCVPDLIFLDIYMPEMNGLQLMRIISKQWPQTKVIGMSGYATEQIARDIIDLGAGDFLTKPIELEQLDDILATIKPIFLNSLLSSR
jgi:two-component system nitrogen regulation response regulator NtrX